MLDEKGHTVHLTDRGVDFMSPGDHDAFMLPDISHGGASDRPRRELMTPAEKLEARREIEGEYAIKSEELNIVHQLLRAHALYENEVNYVVQDGQVLIVDEFTGRTMPGRRWSEGLHQAVEAKEGVQVKGETQTLATITIQNYFRMYEQAGWDDGYGRDGRDRVLRDLQARSGGHSRRTSRSFATTGTTSSTRRVARNTTRSSRRRSGSTTLGYPVLIGTVNVDVSETIAPHVQARRDDAQRAEREVPPARGRDRRGGRAAWRA